MTLSTQTRVDDGKSLVPALSSHRNAPRQIFIRNVSPALSSSNGLRGYSRTDWIHLISQAWVRRSADALADTLELARLVSQARQSLKERREWSHLFSSGKGRLPFGKRKADHLVRIGEAFGEMANENICSQLPAGWRTLSCLAGLGRSLVHTLLAQGRILPGLSLSGAKALVAEYLPQAEKVNPRSSLERRLERFAKFVRANIATWPSEARRVAKSELLKLVQDLSPKNRINHDAH